MGDMQWADRGAGMEGNGEKGEGMFQSIVVKNFRCFSGLALSQFARVNLIAGKNNTGKTALLEAIRLNCDPVNGGLPNEINKERGVTDPLLGYEEVSSWLFWRRHPGQGADVQMQDDKAVSRDLTIQLVDAPTLRERFPEAQKLLRKALGGGAGGEYGPYLVLEYKGPNGETATTVGFTHRNGFSWTATRIPQPLPSVFIPSGTPVSSRDVKFFGELEAAKRKGEILPSLQIIEPRLQNLSLVPLAGELVIHGDIGLPRLVPVPFMGEGTRRLLSVLLAIANSRSGVVLIDEIDNGLHYSVQKQVWQAIADAARQNNVQVFATTHSWECIREAHAAFSSTAPYDFRLHRLDRVEDHIEAVTYDQGALDAALIAGLEMR